MSKKSRTSAPLEFIAPYPPDVCMKRLQTMLPASFQIEFKPEQTDKIQYQFTQVNKDANLKGSGTLAGWAVGEQTRVLCDVHQTQLSGSKISEKVNLPFELFMGGILVIIFIPVTFFLGHAELIPIAIVILFALLAYAGQKTGLMPKSKYDFDRNKKYNVLDHLALTQQKQASKVYDEFVRILK